jgi:mercuric reductase
MIEKSPWCTASTGDASSKTLIHSALFRQEARLGEALGVGTAVNGIDWERLTSHKNKVVKGLRKTKYLDVLHGVPNLRLIKGAGQFIGPRTLKVADEVLRSDRILVATGGFPLILTPASIVSST